MWLIKFLPESVRVGQKHSVILKKTLQLLFLLKVKLPCSPDSSYANQISGDQV